MSHHGLLKSVGQPTYGSVQEVKDVPEFQDGHAFSDIPADTGEKRTRRRHLQQRKATRVKKPPPFREKDRIRRRQMQEDQVFRIAGYCVCKEYEIEDLGSFLKTRYFGSKYGRIYLYTDVVHCKFSDDDKNVFIFPYGVLVFFNFTADQETLFIGDISKFVVEGMEPDQWEWEEIDYRYGERFSVKHDVCTLGSKRSLEKLSVAFAVAQCVKLNVFEERIAEVIEQNKTIPEGLAKTGKIELNRDQISKKVGELFMERNNINLHFDILDTPEYFWEEDAYMPVYVSLYNYLELGKRVGLLNKRLDLLHELFNMLSQQIAHIHNTKLEWIIIFLICMEVMIEIFWNMILKDMLGFF